MTCYSFHWGEGDCKMHATRAACQSPSNLLPAPIYGAGDVTGRTGRGGGVYLYKKPFFRHACLCYTLVEGPMQYALYLPNFDPWGKARDIADLARKPKPPAGTASSCGTTSPVSMSTWSTPGWRWPPWRLPPAACASARSSPPCRAAAPGNSPAKPSPSITCATAAWWSGWAPAAGTTNGPILASRPTTKPAAICSTKPWRSSPACGRRDLHAQRPLLPHPRHDASCPPALQQPRIPIWVGGVWPNPRPLRRMALLGRHVPALLLRQIRRRSLQPVGRDPSRSCAACAHSTAPFDVIALGATPLAQPEESARVVRAYAARRGHLVARIDCPHAHGQPQRSRLELRTAPRQSPRRPTANLK